METEHAIRNLPHSTFKTDMFSPGSTLSNAFYHTIDGIQLTNPRALFSSYTGSEKVKLLVISH